MDNFEVMVNGEALYTLKDHHIQVLCNDIDGNMLLEDLKRRIHWVVMHKYEQCFKRLKNEWDKKLAANGVDMIPTDEAAYISLVVSQPNYKDRKARDARDSTESL